MGVRISEESGEERAKETQLGETAMTSNVYNFSKSTLIFIQGNNANRGNESARQSEKDFDKKRKKFILHQFFNIATPYPQGLFEFKILCNILYTSTALQNAITKTFAFPKRFKANPDTYNSTKISSERNRNSRRTESKIVCKNT